MVEASGQAQSLLVQFLVAELEVAANLHQMLVARLGPSEAVLGKDVRVNIELHGDKLDNAGWCEVTSGKGQW
jgi:hypothetical protein